MNDLKWKVDERAIKYYKDRVQNSLYMNYLQPYEINTIDLVKEWNDMVENGFKLGKVYPTKKNRDICKVYINKMKFTVDTKRKLVKYIDHADFINLKGEHDFNPNERNPIGFRRWDE